MRVCVEGGKTIVYEGNREKRGNLGVEWPHHAQEMNTHAYKTNANAAEPQTNSMKTLRRRFRFKHSLQTAFRAVTMHE